MNSVYMTLDCKALNATEDSSSWSREQEKAFENAVAVYCNDSGDRWEQISLSVQGKSVAEVKHHYDLLVDDIQSIESGRIPLPGYASASSSSANPDVFGDTHYESLQISPEAGLPSAGKTGSRSEQERRKGIAWTEEEHRLFLLGLEKYGKGDWRSISRNFVISRTPTQVASHAQKYFIRRNSVNKDKRRSSIHDITNVGAGDDSHEASITGEANGVGMPTGITPSPPTQPLSSAPVVGVYGTPISQPIGGSLAVGTPVNLPSGHMAYGIRAPVAGIVPGAPTSMAYPSPQASSAQR